MLIGIECSRLTQHNRTGTQNYLYYLIKSISDIDVKNSYILYFKISPTKEFFEELINKNPNFSYKVIKNNISWTQVGLAKECWINAPDILFAPWHTIPIIHKPRMKTIAVIHGLEYKYGRGGPTAFTCCFADRLIAVSEFTKKAIMEKFHVNGDKISVIYEGIDINHFYQRSESEISKILSRYEITTNYIFFISTLGLRKNIPAMLEAFSRLVKEGYDDLIFVLGGTHEKGYEKVYSLPNKYGIKDKVRFIGRVKDEDLPSLLSGAVFLAYASLTEGFGLPILEAMSCGIPVLTSNTGAMPEISANASYLVDPYSVDSIYTGMKELLQNQKLRYEIVSHGYERIKEFSWKKTAEGVLDIFQDIYNERT